MTIRTLAVIALLALAASASAVDLDSLKKTLGTKQESSQSNGLASSLGGMAMPVISGDTAGNAAGVLGYCVKRKYLSGNAVASVKDKLLSKFGLGTPARAEQDPGYRDGLQGVLQGKDGHAFNLDKVSDKLKDKGCEYVLKHSTSLI